MQQSGFTFHKRFSYSSLLLAFLLALAVFLSGKIVWNLRQNKQDRLRSILLLSQTAEAAAQQGRLPSKEILTTLEKAYHVGIPATKPFAGFLSSCYYLHKDPLRGAYYAGLAYSQRSQAPSQVHALLKEITEAQAQQNYREALEKSQALLRLTTGSSHPNLRFFTLLRIIELKGRLQQNRQTELEEVNTSPLFQELRKFYKDGEWSLMQYFSTGSDALAQR